jgi:hypothetical protein
MAQRSSPSRSRRLNRAPAPLVEQDAPATAAAGAGEPQSAPAGAPRPGRALSRALAVILALSLVDALCTTAGYDAYSPSHLARRFTADLLVPVAEWLGRRVAWALMLPSRAMCFAGDIADYVYQALGPLFDFLQELGGRFANSIIAVTGALISAPLVSLVAMTQSVKSYSSEILSLYMEAVPGVSFLGSVLRAMGRELMRLSYNIGPLGFFMAVVLSLAAIVARGLPPRWFAVIKEMASPARRNPRCY